MATVTTKTGKKRTYKNYELGVGAYSRKGYAKLIHKRSGNKKYVKL